MMITHPTLKHSDYCKSEPFTDMQAWKWRYLHIWVSLAHNHDVNIHVGRVGTLKDMQKCIYAGVDSADGAALIRNQKHTEIMRFLNMANNVDNYLCKEEY